MENLSFLTPQLLFCASLAFSVARTLPALVRYYSWFKNSGLDIARHRGYGQTACRFYGIIGAPALGVWAMATCGVLFMLCLILPNLPWVPLTWQSPVFGLALVFYHLYFSQLYCEAHVGAHVTVLVPHVLFLLMLSPVHTISGGLLGQERERAGAFTAWLVKLVIAAAYGSAGVSKIASSIKARRAWWDGATLQASVFEALLLCRKGTHFSFGVPTPFAHEAQVFAYLRPQLLLVPFSIVAVALEAVAPLLLLLPAALVSRPFAAVGVSFHYGIAYLQNVDFVSWWGPAYAFFILDPAAAADAGELFGPLGAWRAAAALAPCHTALSLVYVATFLTAMVVLHFFPSVEMLPFSCFPMFKNLQDLFDPSARKWLWLSDKSHDTGTLKNYCFPFCRPQCVRADELDALPFKYLLFGHNGSSEDVVHANFEVSHELRELLWRIRAEGSSGPGVYASGQEALLRLLGLLQAAQAEFDRLPRVQAYLPPSPILGPEEPRLCLTSDTLGETASTWSAVSSRSAETAASKLNVLDNIVQTISGASTGNGPLRVLCTSARTLDLVRKHSTGTQVAATLLTDGPADTHEPWAVCRSQEELSAELQQHGVGFDAVIAERELLGRLPPSVLTRGARIVLA